LEKVKASWLLFGLLAITVIMSVYRPHAVYSFAPQIFATGIEVDESVNTAGSRLKHARTTNGCTTNSSCTATLTWSGTPFADTNYTVVCTPESTIGEGIISVTNKTTTGITLTFTGSTHTGFFGVGCIAMHD
jgi:hypothetical protein